MAQIKPMDFCPGQGANRSNSSTIARICNAAMGKKTRFYGPDSVQHHTSTRPALSRHGGAGLRGRQYAVTSVGARKPDRRAAPRPGSPLGGQRITRSEKRGGFSLQAIIWGFSKHSFARAHTKPTPSQKQPARVLTETFLVHAWANQIGRAHV